MRGQGRATTCCCWRATRPFQEGEDQSHSQNLVTHTPPQSNIYESGQRILRGCYANMELQQKNLCAPTMPTVDAEPIVRFEPVASDSGAAYMQLRSAARTCTHATPERPRILCLSNFPTHPNSKRIRPFICHEMHGHVFYFQAHARKQPIARGMHVCTRIAMATTVLASVQADAQLGYEPHCDQAYICTLKANLCCLRKPLHYQCEDEEEDFYLSSGPKAVAQEWEQWYPD